MILSLFCKKIRQPKHIIIARIDNIGDVILTLPLAALLKKAFPSCRVTLLTRNYAQAIVLSSQWVDDWLSWDDLSKLPADDAAKQLSVTGADVIIHVLGNEELAKIACKANIRYRIGFLDKHLLYNKKYCNFLPYYPRRGRDKTHHALFPLLCLKFFGLKTRYSLSELTPLTQLTPSNSLPAEFADLLDKSRFNLILHPGSNANATEWSAENFKLLINSLPADKFKIFISGSGAEEQRFADLIAACPQAVNLINKMPLTAFISFIARCDGLVACSTGPLHIAAAVGIHCLGLFVPQRHRDIRCWQPLGPKAEYISKPGVCNKCGKLPACDCINYITTERVKQRLLAWLS